jgi:hypothetical protein
MARIRTAAEILEQQRRDHEPGGFVHRTKAKAAALPPVTEQEPKMKKDDLWPSKFLKASDFPEPRVLKIKKARLETLKNRNGEDEKLIVYFEGEDKPLPLNRTNFDSICDTTGQYDSDHWPGHTIELFSTTTLLNSQEVDCIRVRAPAKAAAAKARPSAAKKKSASADMNDEIGF